MLNLKINEKHNKDKQNNHEKKDNNENNDQKNFYLKILIIKLLYLNILKVI